MAAYRYLVLALFAQLGEHFLIHLPGLGLLLPPLLTALQPLHLLGPDAGQLAVGGRQVAVPRLYVLVLLLEVFDEFLLEDGVAGIGGKKKGCKINRRTEEKEKKWCVDGNEKETNIVPIAEDKKMYSGSAERP